MAALTDQMECHSRQDSSNTDKSYGENPEEQPLTVAGKSFNELLEDQMMETGKDIDKESKIERKPFLRRGMGLTRFNLPPDPTQQPSRTKRSKSQPRLSDIQSRLNQVGFIIAFDHLSVL